MFYIEIYNQKTDKKWKELFQSYYLFKKRVTKLKYSKDLIILERSNL